MLLGNRHDAGRPGVEDDAEVVLMTIKVDTTKCTGIGLCEMTAPTIYEVGGDGQSHVLKDEPSPEEMSSVEEAIGNCPTGALSIED